MPEAITPDNNRAHARANEALDEMFNIPSIRYDSAVYHAALLLDTDPDDFLYGERPAGYDPEAEIRKALYAKVAEVCRPLVGIDPEALTEAHAKPLRDALDIVARLEVFAERSRNAQPSDELRLLASGVSDPRQDIED